MKNALWDRVAILFLVILMFVLVWWGVSHYFGDEGVRFSMIGVATLIVFGVVFGMFAVAVRMVTAVHNNTIQGIVEFQEADDRGETARMNAWRQVTKNDGDMVKIAAKFAQEQAKAIAAADRERFAWENRPQLPPPRDYDTATWETVPTVGVAGEYDIAD